MRIFLTLLLYPLSLPAQQPAPPERKDSIVVTGNYEPMPLDESERSVSVIPIRNQSLLFNTFIDALRLDPSVDLRQRAPDGIQADVSIRGGTFGQTLVLLNGLRMSDPQTGHHNLDLPVPLESIERIEVLHGAGSSLYGSDAVGGVINLITSPPETSEIRLQTAVGNFGVNQQRVAVTGVLGKLSEQVTFSRDFSSGFTPNRDYRNLLFGSATRWRSALGATDIDLGYSDKPFGAQGFYGNYPSWERTKGWFAGLRQELGEHTEATFSYRRHTDLFVLFRDNPPRYTNRHLAESWTASLRRRNSVSNNVTIHYGIEGFGDSIVSNNLGAHSRARGAAYLSLDARVLQRWSVTAAIRNEIYRGLPGEWSPTLGIGYWASSKWKLRAGASRAFRLPTYTDLYYSDPANRGNPLLRPEHAWSYEGGVDFHPTPDWRLQTTVFHRRDTNGIDYIRPAGSTIWDAVNVQRLRFTGIEASASRRWKHSIFDWTYTGMHGAASPLAGFQSKYAFNYLTHSGLFGWTGQLPGRITARTRIGAAERRAYKAYPAWDASLAGAIRNLHPYIQLTNLTNTYTEDIPGVANPGRAIIGGVEWVWRRR
ncbi:MAG: TonB-dependent receptor [Bryobacterales bacterium]|nr:TonB-dependent receptor [Bryobacterales bacterium]